MITGPYENPESLIQALRTLAKAPSWEEQGITVDSVNTLLKNNVNLINSQIGKTTSPEINDALLKLSARIAKESSSPEGDALATKISNLAHLYFNEVSEPDWSKLPQEIIEHEILPKMPKKPTPEIDEPNFLLLKIERPKSGLGNAKEVSHLWKQLANDIRLQWIDDNHIALEDLGFNQKEAIDFVIANKSLKSANLLNFRNINIEDLKRLTDQRPDLIMLAIDDAGIINSHVNKDFGLEKLTNLRTLDYRCSYNYGNIAKAINHMPYLESLTFSGLSPEILQQAIKQPHLLKNLTFMYRGDFSQLGKTLQSFPNLTSLDLRVGNDSFDFQTPFNAEILLNILTNIPHLTTLTLYSPLPTSIVIRTLTTASSEMPLLKNLTLLTNFNSADLIRVLSYYPHLETCKVNISEADMYFVIRLFPHMIIERN